MPKKMIKVRVKKEIAKSGGGFYDFSSKTDIYPKKPGEVFEVPVTPFIERKLATGELILVEGKLSDPDKKEDEEPKSDQDPEKAK